MFVLHQRAPYGACEREPACPDPDTDPSSGAPGGTANALPEHLERRAMALASALGRYQAIRDMEALAADRGREGRVTEVSVPWPVPRSRTFRFDTYPTRPSDVPIPAFVIASVTGWGSYPIRLRGR